MYIELYDGAQDVFQRQLLMRQFAKEAYIRTDAKKSPSTKKPGSPPHSEAVPPWTSEEQTTLMDLKKNQRLRPSWKAVADRLKRSEADVRNQWSLLQANRG